MDLTKVYCSFRGKKKALNGIEEEDDDPELRESIPKVTWSVTKDKAVRELLEVRPLPHSPPILPLTLPLLSEIQPPHRR